MKKQTKMIKDAPENKVQGKLREPFSSNPKYPAICEVKITNEERDMLHVHTFAAWYSARKFIEAITKDRKVKEINENVIKTDDGTKIKSIHLADILGHKYNALEEEWELPAPYPNMIRMFRGESYKKMTMPDGSDGGHDLNASQDKTVGRTAKVKDMIRKPKSERTPRPPKDGMVSIADICADLKCEPRIARGILRDAKITKPEGGWSWPKGDKRIEAIKAAVAKGLKAK